VFRRRGLGWFRLEWDILGEFLVTSSKISLMVVIGTIRCRLDAHDDDDDNAYL
jgi:hypothetical protein